MLSQVFYRHGRLCASHPWEVIIAFLTLILWKLSTGTAYISNVKGCGYECSEENKSVEIVLLTVARCVGILYLVQQFLRLNKLGSTYLVAIGGLFTIFCLVPCIVFSISTVNFLKGDFTELNKALPFYFLLMDLTKAGLLAQFALSSSTQEEVEENIAQGMSILGPTITLDTIVEALVIGVGTLSGVKRLEELCRFACISAVINYFVFMIFFPACLSLILELSRDRDEGRPVWHLSTLTRILQQEEEQKPNPVLQRVKVIMSAGLVLVHAHSRWPLLVASKALQQASKASVSDSMGPYSNWDIYMQRWFGGSEPIIMIALLTTITFAANYFPSREDLTEHLASAAASSLSRSPYGFQITRTTQGIQTDSHEGHHSAKPQNSLCSRAVQTADCKGFPCNQNLVPSFVQSSMLVPCVTTQSASFTVGEEPNIVNITDEFVQTGATNNREVVPRTDFKNPRSIEECKKILQSEVGGIGLTEDEIILLAEKRIIQSHKLETIVNNPKRGVSIRRKLLGKLAKRGEILESLPYADYDYKLVMGSCCENVIGYVPIPVGVAGPLLLDGEMLYIPMATTEGCLVASTNRGCRALALSGGVNSNLLADGMTRGPVVKLPSEAEAGNIKRWIEKKENFEVLKASFDSTSRFARLQKIDVQIAGCCAYLRFNAVTGDAMGMNMLSKGADKALNKLCEIFPSVEIISLSGNYCTDKKPAAINWIQGRGKYVVCGATIPAEVVKEVLKTDVATLIKLNIHKNFIGSAMAGSIGGFNAQAANIVTAIFLATGQDPAQNVTSSNCLTMLEDLKGDLRISCTMPSIEVGTVGGGTFLPAQSSCLEMLGVKGPCEENPGNNAAKLARIICATVLAGELSLLSALAEGNLVRSHMTHNRSSLTVHSLLQSPLQDVHVNQDHTS
ncbi:3-hydroxy-3-methylglutaryl-coenzyme A reductase, partial [Stegodyphus mimosarum]